MKADIWKPKFIEALRNSGNVRASCQMAGISRRAAYKAREKSELFAHQWDEALEEAIDTLEAAAWSRARDGVKRVEPIMYQGQKVSEKVITEYSDSLMTLLLKAHRPEKYRERFDVEIKDLRSRAETAIADVMRRTGKDRAEAIALLKPHIPQISELIH
jgi:N-methylhydantoinase A/oxoprolinase/acetone carboxylase beta subunit